MLIKVTASWQDPEGHEGTAAAVAQDLPTMPDVPFATLAEAPLVAQREQELTMANLQDARFHCGAPKRLRGSGAYAAPRGSPSLQGTLETLRDIAAERDAVMLSKEALYSSRSMGTRLAMSINSAEVPTADYSRRKGGRGQAAPQHKR